MLQQINSKTRNLGSLEQFNYSLSSFCSPYLLVACLFLIYVMNDGLERICSTLHLSKHLTNALYYKGVISKVYRSKTTECQKHLGEGGTSFFCVVTTSPRRAVQVP